MDPAERPEEPITPATIREEIRALRRELTRLRLESAQRIEKLKVLNVIGTSLAALLDLSLLFERIVEMTTGLLDCSSGSIMLVTSEDTLCIRAARGLPADVETLCIPMDRGIAGHVARTGELVFIEDLTADERFQPSERPHYESSSLISVPIRMESAVLGVINVTNKRGGASFRTEDVEFLQTIASQSAIAIENARLHQHMRQLANTDGVTGLYNHRYFQERLLEEFERSRRYSKRAMSLAMIDIDYFKTYNDRFGHQAGDVALTRVAEALRQHSRRSDIVCRYGGEEFAIIIPEVGRPEACIFADRLRQTIADIEPGDGGLRAPLTISIGLATAPMDARTPAALIESADRALYQAKAEGRNRVVACELEVAPDVGGDG